MKWDHGVRGAGALAEADAVESQEGRARVPDVLGGGRRDGRSHAPAG